MRSDFENECNGNRLAKFQASSLFKMAIFQLDD